MRVQVVRWEGEVLFGRIANDPEAVPSLRCGSPLEADLEDWVISQGNEMEGGYTVKVLMARM